MTATDTFRVRKVAGTIGAIIEGVKITPDLDDAQIDAIKAALHRHKVIFIRDQHHLDDATQAAFADRLGPPYENTSLPDEVIAKNSGMYVLDGSKPGGRAESWHTDSTFSHRPPAITILRSVVIPEYGGDTTWANCAAAYDTLHPALRDLADQLWALHSNRIDLAGQRPTVTAEELRHFQTITTAKHVSTEHPIVQIHPETGERSLLVGNYAQRILGVTTQESDHIKALFQEHIVRLENTVRWRWQVADVVMWDNFATQHKVINDWGDQTRVMRRWTVAGSVPKSIQGAESRSVTVA